jgi:RNA polymerase sigma factor (sigma-70 family)
VPEEPPCELNALRQAVANLPAVARQLLTLLFESGWTMQAVANLWGLTREAVRQRRNVILKGLRRKLQAD